MSSSHGGMVLLTRPLTKRSKRVLRGGGGVGRGGWRRVGGRGLRAHIHAEADRPAPALPKLPRHLPVHLLRQPVGDPHQRHRLRLDPHDRREQPDAADARNHRDGDRLDRAALRQLQRDGVARAELVVSLRIRRQRAADAGDGLVPVRAQRHQAVEEGVPERIRGEALGPRAQEELGGIVGAQAGVAEAAPEDVHDLRLGVRPAHAGHALAVHVGAIAPVGGRLRPDPLPDQRRVGVDAGARGVADGLHAEHEAAGRLVEVGVLGSGGGEGVAGRGGSLRGGRAGWGGGRGHAAWGGSHQRRGPCRVGRGRGPAARWPKGGGAGRRRFISRPIPSGRTACSRLAGPDGRIDPGVTPRSVAPAPSPSRSRGRSTWPRAARWTSPPTPA